MKDLTDNSLLENPQLDSDIANANVSILDKIQRPVFKEPYFRESG